MTSGRPMISCPRTKARMGMTRNLLLNQVNPPSLSLHARGKHCSLPTRERLRMDRDLTVCPVHISWNDRSRLNGPDNECLDDSLLENERSRRRCS